ncbi:MAG: HPr family phosphocarrier protein [Clostridium sp.]|nr:HPr family phosphocarrier protein [Clostridium sp.]
MIERRFILKDEMGLHARPAAMLMMKMRKVLSSVKISCKGEIADGKDVMDIMSLHTVAGDEVVFCIEGPDEEEAMKAVESVMNL